MFLHYTSYFVIIEIFLSNVLLSTYLLSDITDYETP